MTKIFCDVCGAESVDCLPGASVLIPTRDAGIFLSLRLTASFHSNDKTFRGLYLGESIICPNCAINAAEQFGNSFPLAVEQWKKARESRKMKPVIHPPTEPITD